MELTLDEKTSNAVERAREQEAEKHFFDKAQPFFPLGFSVGYRNPGHWDVSAKRCPGRASAWLASHPHGDTSDSDDTRERAFRIRGEPGKVVVFDERWDPHRPHPREDLKFRTVSAAMLWIVEELMREPPQFDAKTAMAAADALKVFNGHDSGPNLTRRYGEKWWDEISKIERGLRAMAKSVTPGEQLDGER